jgi:hypothetical protein
MWLDLCGSDADQWLTFVKRGNTLVLQKRRVIYWLVGGPLDFNCWNVTTDHRFWRCQLRISVEVHLWPPSVRSVIFRANTSSAPWPSFCKSLPNHHPAISVRVLRCRSFRTTDVMFRCRTGRVGVQWGVGVSCYAVREIVLHAPPIFVFDRIAITASERPTKRQDKLTAYEEQFGTRTHV